jgi:hypothetical protein
MLTKDNRYQTEVPVGKRKDLWVRGAHRYSFRPGEWAFVLGFLQHPESGHWCMEVLYADGVRDSIPLVDSANYEWSEEPRD